MKKQFTLSDSDFATLDRVAQSCGLSHSQTLSQFIRRYSSHLEQLLATNVNFEQPTSTSGNLEQPKAAMSQPQAAKHPTTADTKQAKATPSPIDAFTAMEF